MKIKKAVIPAAGIATRFLPAAKAMPKEMFPIIDKPAIQFVVEEAVKSGITDILIITGRGKRAIEDHFDNSLELENVLEKKGKIEELKKIREISKLANVHYIRQKEPKGLGHAISCAEEHIGNEPFAVLLADDIIEGKVPCTKVLVDMYEKYGTSIMALEEIEKKKIPTKGIADVEKINGSDFLIKKFIEKPSIEQAPSNLAWNGRCILTPEIFESLKQTKPGVGNEVQITDAINNLMQKQKVYGFIYEGIRIDVGNPFDYVKSIINFAISRDDIGPKVREHLKSLKI